MLSPHIHRKWWETDIPRWNDTTSLSEMERTDGSDKRKTQARIYLKARLLGADESDANRTVKLVYTP